MRFSVMRDGEQIGTTTVQVRHDGQAMSTEVKTHVQVKIAYVTVYRYDQTETEQWNNGKLQAMSAVTDENGTVHHVSARADGNALAVDTDGKVNRVDPSLMPVSLWNPALMRCTKAIDPQNGNVTPVSVVDKGREDVLVGGHPTPAHHYAIATSFPQDVWYDDHHQLIQVELRGSDGSKIHYQPG
ncbi:MAG: hypothetical protein JO001_22490 [Alphaproteobacteria bacterium]|nr:hypothetical protein [Alphaproteobacteria bacterium]